MRFTIEHETEDVGRWLPEVPELPGVFTYGTTAQEAMAKAQALALRASPNASMEVEVTNVPTERVK